MDTARQEGNREDSGRVAQRRRTRRAILDAAAGLLAAGDDPSVTEIARVAEVSRRTIYMYFPTIEQLVLDATLSALEVDMDIAFGAVTAGDVRARVAAAITTIADTLSQTLPLGRRLIKLTVDVPPSGDGPKRGYRRVGWIEQALAPARATLGEQRHQTLVSMLAPLVGWESFIVLLDIRGLDVDQAKDVVVRSAITLVDASLADAVAG